ncbi:MAG: putative transcriptional regulator [Polaribacter sp.]|jgi:predicted transcriptional regulator
MNIQSEKDQLIQQIMELQDSSVIKKVREFLSKETKNDDWFNSLSSSEKESIKKGLQDLENGNVISHKEVMASVKSKIASLK